MTLEHGLLMGFIGCSVTFIGFFIGYQKEKIKKISEDFKEKIL